MFGAEPQEEWNERDVADFERHASVCLHRCIIAVIRAAVLLLASAPLSLTIHGGPLPQQILVRRSGPCLGNAGSVSLVLLQGHAYLGFVAEFERN